MVQDRLDRSETHSQIFLCSKYKERGKEKDSEGFATRCHRCGNADNADSNKLDKRCQSCRSLCPNDEVLT